MDKKAPLDILLHRARLRRAREGNAKDMFKGIMDEIYSNSGYPVRRCWEMTIELIADALGIIDEPWRYSVPNLPNEPLFKGKITKARREVPKKLAEHIKDSGLIEEFIEAARAKPYDYIGDIFMEERLSNNRLGQMLTPRSVAQFMVKSVMTEYELRKERLWIDAESLVWAESYFQRYMHPPLWVTDALKRATKNIEETGRPQTILDPAVGTGRFLFEMSLMYPDEPLVLFGIDIDVWMYRACLVNMALFSKHPYTIICGNTLRIDGKYIGPSSPLWDFGNTWEPADISMFYIKPPPVTSESFNLAGWIKQKTEVNR